MNSNSYVDLSLIASINYWENAVNSLNSLQINIRSFKFLAMWSRMQTFKDALKISVPQIMIYWFNIFIIMFAFACAGFVAFGVHMEDYKDLGASIITQFRGASGQFNFEGAKNQHTFLGPVLLIAYAMSVYFCLVGMFMAINCYTYDIVLHKLHLDADEDLIDGPEMIEMVKLKMRNYLEAKVPFLRKRREAQEKAKREEELAQRAEDATDEEQAELVDLLKLAIDHIGREAADEAFKGSDFYDCVIVQDVKYIMPFTRGELQDMSAICKDLIKKQVR